MQERARDDNVPRILDMEERVTVPARERFAKDVVSDVIRGGLILQRAVLSLSSMKTVLGSAENALRGSRIVVGLEQQ